MKSDKINTFEAFADIDIDGAVFQVGIESYALGPPGPAIRINTGAIEVQIRAHATDIDAVIEALEKARKRIKKWGKK